MQDLNLYNTLSRKKEVFKPLTEGKVGMYVCGPTVYGDAHLGHARPGVTFDVVFRYMLHMGYKTRYVRNITDVGHLVNDADEGEDKIAKKARLDQLEPMEVVAYYTRSYHKDMAMLNTLPPSIEPTATGHIIEQIQMIEKILANGYAYIVDGNVYFDVVKYNATHEYGKLSGRNIDNMISNTRDLDGQSDKKNSVDFALWKKASPEHIMRWPSPWSEGFPGWHLECSAMSTKYLGARFDIHGGGLDLVFPHHEAEIAQSCASDGHEAVNYWMHNNMITINGQKMGKSLGNFITLSEFFSGSHDKLEQAYNPMTIRFFILQAHYRSTVDFSNEALLAAEKGMNKLMAALVTLEGLAVSESSTVNVEEFKTKFYSAINDDFNTPILVAHLFDAVKQINSIAAGKGSIDKASKEALTKLMNDFCFDILGLKKVAAEAQDGLADDVMDVVLGLRKIAKENKDWTTADFIRDELGKLNITVKDSKDGASWEKE
ncbi:MAG: cysteine--tRNA ligase [Flavobacteriales bacterium]|jgi:cysteinyl-tRNA synthetase|tara:strand:- start:3860 stop:5323 length:1464 start_codon:yes stop_codon:yes gene_type:complete